MPHRPECTRRLARPAGFSPAATRRRSDRMMRR
jgi:hypothetical protein